MKPNSQSSLFLLVVLLTGACALYSIAPEGTKDGIWPHNVLRNWEEFGIAKLGGKLVYNPGGIDAIEHPTVYSGHRPTSFYLSYAVGHLLSGAGRNGLYFYLLVSALVGWCIWHMLGRQGLAVGIAAFAVFCPGYLRTTLVLDPLTIPVWLGFPTLLIFTKVLREEKITWLSAISLIILMCLYTALNWTACFSLAIGTSYLWVVLRRQRQRVVLFVLLAAVGVCFVTGLSLVSKQSDVRTTGTSLGLSQFYNMYLFGPAGYSGYPMTWPKAVTRLLFANTIGLLPLWLAFGVLFFKLRTLGVYSKCLILLPLITALLSIGFMRNYFAHHPWMSCPVVLFGVVFSILLMMDASWHLNPETNTTLPEFNRLGRWPWLSASLGYGLLLATILRINSAEEDTLRHFIQTQTKRRDFIVVNSVTDSVLASNTERFSQLFDRKVITDSELKELKQNQSFNGKTLFHLSSKSVENSRERGHLTISDSLVVKTSKPILDWYRQTIARRSQGDRLDLGSMYFLFEE